MLETILLILKIIGICLLSLIGLVLFLVLLVIFVPIRYNISVDKKNKDNNDFNVKAKFSFLLHILNGTFVYPSNGNDMLKVRVLFFKIFPRSGAQNDKEPIEDNNKKEKTGKSKKIDKWENEESEVEEDNGFFDSASAVSDIKSDLTENESSAAFDSEESSEEDNPTIKGFVDKLVDFFKNIKCKVKSIYDKIKDIIKNIKYYYAVVTSDTFDRAFSLVKKKVVLLLKKILPRKMKGKIEYASSEPDNLAMVFGIYSVFNGLFRNDLDFKPVYNEDYFTGNLFFKGYFNIFSILIIAINVYFNKDVKRVLKLLKKEK